MCDGFGLVQRRNEEITRRILFFALFARNRVGTLCCRLGTLNKSREHLFAIPAVLRPFARGPETGFAEISSKLT